MRWRRCRCGHARVPFRGGSHIIAVASSLALTRLPVPDQNVAPAYFLQRKLDVDVLVTGGTHVHSVVEYERRCYVNPGSVTGAYTPTGERRL